MKKDVLASVENVSKKYCRSLKRSMIYGISDLSRNVVGMSSKSHKLRKNEFWALDNISFELKKGDVLGIIGPNGSGKSTLLKLLNGIFWPDKGQITIKGRVGALIEVGAGFHPLLTGKENIFLNGAILGMTKKEIKNKFDEIVDFAGIGDFLDTPVKHYSSGMFVRLGFSVAAHCDPDILLIDEILSVGDMAFQARSRSKIHEIQKKGVAIILVSHNMHTISHLAKKAILLNKGIEKISGITGEVIEKYKSLENVFLNKNEKKVKTDISGISIKEIKIFNKNNDHKLIFDPGEYIKIRFFYHSSEPIINPVFNLVIRNSDDGSQITGIRNDADNVFFGDIEGEGFIDLSIMDLNLLPGMYKLSLTVFNEDGFAFFESIQNFAEIEIRGGSEINGVVFFPHNWEIRKILKN